MKQQTEAEGNGNLSTAELLVVVPARGGSTGVPRKNVQTIDGQPLVARAVTQARRAAASMDVDARVVVVTNDPQISQVARLAGAEVLDRTPESETPDAPVAVPVAEAAARLGWGGPVVTWQPSTIIDDDDAEKFLWAASSARQSLVAVRPDRRLAWLDDEPLFAERVNRQYGVGSRAVEVGLFSVPYLRPTLSAWASEADLITLPSAHDIDTPADLTVARASFGPSLPVVFRVDCGDGAGTGHLMRALTVADELAGRDIAFDIEGLDPWARDRVKAHGYPLGLSGDALWIVDSPIPPTPAHLRVGRHARLVVVFEDEGEAGLTADLAVNELLYAGPGLAGPRYAVVRPEFRVARHTVRDDAAAWQVVVSFGGTDPARLTGRVAATLAGLRVAPGDGIDRPVEVHVVEPPNHEDCEPGRQPLAELFAAADLVVCSAGRTVHEAMAVGTPVVSIPVNHREAARRAPPGVVRLPLAHTVADDDVAAAVGRVLGDVGLRREMHALGVGLVDGRGVERVAHAIDGLVRDLL